jgi:hypothetical protein
VRHHGYRRDEGLVSAERWREEGSLRGGRDKRVHERLDIPHIPSIDRERHNASEAGHLLGSDVIIWVRRMPWVPELFHEWMAVEDIRHVQSVLVGLSGSLLKGRDAGLYFKAIDIVTDIAAAAPSLQSNAAAVWNLACSSNISCRSCVCGRGAKRAAWSNP